jgi:hypothetical protein
MALPVYYFRFLAKSKTVKPKHLDIWVNFLLVFVFLPVAASNLPGAWYFT